jgi:hypothetical protein
MLLLCLTEKQLGGRKSSASLLFDFLQNQRVPVSHRTPRAYSFIADGTCGFASSLLNGVAVQGSKNNQHASSLWLHPLTFHKNRGLSVSGMAELQWQNIG